MKNKLNELFRWGVYHILNGISTIANFVCRLAGHNLQADLGLSWLVFLESRRVEREILGRTSQRLNKQKEAEEKMRLAKEDIESYGQDISQQQ